MSTGDGTPLPRFRGGLGAAVATEGKMHLADGVGVKSMTRTLGVSAKVISALWQSPLAHPAESLATMPK